MSCGCVYKYIVKYSDPLIYYTIIKPQLHVELQIIIIIVFLHTHTHTHTYTHTHIHTHTYTQSILQITSGLLVTSWILLTLVRKTSIRND